MGAPVDVLADLRMLANVGEYRDLREAMENCLRPHERAGFADLLGRMVGNADAIEKLIEAANACALSLTPADDSDNDGLYVVRARYVHELRAALRAVGGAK